MRWRSPVAVIALASLVALTSADVAARENKKTLATRRAFVAAAIADPRRYIADRDLDSYRKPAEVLDFLGVTPHMKVLDFMADGGYFAELLARVVGPRGYVIAYNPPRALRTVGRQFERRYADERLPNVESLVATRDDLYLSLESLDAALFALTYHELYESSTDGAPPDPRPIIALVHRGLRPGGVVVVQDHAAQAGSDPVRTAATLHRVDPALVRRDFEAAGFEFEAESPAFRNAADDHTQDAHDIGMLNNTDRFMFRFRKPRR